MTADLFPELIDKARHGAEWWTGRYQCRNWNGFFQSREDGRGKWQFYVVGFTDGPPGGEQTAHVALIDRGERLCGAPCPIDARNRIQVMGRWYGPENWKH